jgi:Na+-driven multidrug efflux pump
MFIQFANQGAKMCRFPLFDDSMKTAGFALPGPITFFAPDPLFQIGLHGTIWSL